MDTVLYKATTGSQIDFVKQSLTANNLANINTPGFKADLFQAELQYMQSANGEKEPFTVMKAAGIDATDGAIMTTGRDLDVAIQGEGWFAALDSKGKEGYTRTGSFQLDGNGQLTTGSGKPVLGDGGPIAIPPAKEIHIAGDGTISIVPVGGDSKTLVTVDRLKLVKVDAKDLVRGPEGLLMTQSGKPGEVDGTIKVVSEALEGSNVNSIEQMVNMIEFSRQFDSQMKMMDTIGQNDQKLAQLLQE